MSSPLFASSNTTLEDEEPPQQGALSLSLVRGIVAGLGMVLVAGFTGLIIMLVVTFLRLDSQKSAPFPPQQMLSIPAGAVITSSSFSGKHLLLHLSGAPEGERMMIYDVSTGKLLSNVHIVREAKRP